MKQALISAIVVLCLVLGGCLYWGYTLETAPAGPTDPVLSDTRPTESQNVTTAPTETVPPTTLPETVPPTTLPPEPQPEVFTLSFAGDCTLGSMPEWMELSYAFVNVVGTNYDHPFQGVRHLFESDDCTFVNLESVLANDGVPEEKMFTFRGPTDYINILTGSSVEAVNLANNHSYDFGEDGYTTTKAVLDAGGVVYSEHCCATLMTTDSGLTIGIYGVAHVLNKTDMEQDVAMLKEAGAEIIIAAIHWGEEGKYRANETQKYYAHLLIDAGVNIVWGHHPHVLQPIEEYNGGIIYYSLGNFSFGGNHNPTDKDTVVLQQQVIRQVDGTVVLGELTIVPCRLSTYTWKNDFQPTPYEADSEEYARVISKLDGSFTGPDLIIDRGDKDDKDDEDDKDEEKDPDKDDPETPGEGTDPETPGEGTDPETPGEGTDPETPGEGTDPETPGEGTDPEIPGEGTNPEIPGEGTDPEIPGEGTDPEIPGEGTEPETPGEGTEPETPGEGTEPSEPDTPA